MKIRLLLVLILAGLLLAGCADTSAVPTSTAAAPETPAPAATNSPVEATAGSTSLPPTGDGPTTVPTRPAPTAAPTGATAPSDAVSFPDPSAYEWREVAAGLAAPIGLSVAEDGTNRLFVIEKAGLIRIIQDERLLDAPFLDITDRVGSRGSEQGLLGLAFSPDYEQNGYFYVNYTDQNGNTVVSRFSRGGDANQADPGSEDILLRQDQPYPNHNGGGVVFGPDGYLYLSLGDGGSAGDPQGNGQNLDTLLGKILRIDVSQGDSYAIPADNPFQTGKTRHEVWAYGLRNPWRFSFDRLTGDLYIADVGQNQWEEIDFQPAGSPGGANFGWSYKEATHSYKGNPPADITLVDPIYEYSHSEGCSVTGGYVYRGQMAEWQGIYLFGDYCSGSIWGLLPGGSSTGQKLWQLTGTAISSFGQDEQGEVYVVNIAGTINKLVTR